MSLLLWYPFAQDGREQGASCLAPTTVPTFEANGILGKNAFLNSAEINTGLELLTNWNPWTQNVTMSAWIKLNFNECKEYVKKLTYNSSAHTPTGCIIGSTSYGGLGICWSGTKVYTDSGNVDITGINVFGYIRGSAQKTTASAAITFDKWTHIALVATQETGTLSFYVDGVLKGTASYSGTTATTGSRPFVMGHSQVYGGNGPGGKLPMRLSDVRLYDEALSLMEIKELSKGLMIHYAFNDVASETTTNLITKVSTVNRCVKYLDGVKVDWATNSGDTYFFMDTSSPIVSGKTYTLSFICDGIGSANITFAISNVSATHTVKLKDGFNSYTFVANDTIANRFFFDDINRNTSSVFTITNLQLEEKDHSTPYTIGTRTYNVMFDDSGNGHDAIPYDITLSTDTNNGTLAAKFNGSTSYYEVPVPRSNMFSTPYTLSFWVNPDDNDRAVYFGDHNTVGGVSMNFERKSGGKLRYYHGGSPDKEFNVSAPVGQWTMITITSDGTNMRAYENGVLKETYKFTPTIQKTSGHMRIGRDNRSDYTALAGYISDFRWYGTALSEEDIKNLYDSKAAVDKLSNFYTNEFIELDTTNVDITKKYTIKTNEIVEGQENGLYKDGHISANTIYEI